MTSIAKAISGINVAKVTTSASSLLSQTTKKFDISSLSKTTSKLNIPTTFVKKNASTLLTTGKKTSAQLASEITGFASHPGASKQLKRVTSAMAANPKIAAAGITATAAAGYIAFQMANGATFEEAMGNLVDVVADVVDEVADTVTDVAGDVIDKTLTKLLGENYMNYVYAVGVVFLVLFLLKVKSLVRTII